MNTIPEIVLASRSPRRRELMARIAPEFRVVPVDVDETSVAEKDPVRFAVEAAVLKARAAAEFCPEAIVIGADTVVALHHAVLGKPADRESAREMLRSLSGRRHRVITGLALFKKDEDRLITGSELTYVTFRPLTEEMIEGYLDNKEYLDKAGAYAVQDIGDAFVRRIKGDYDNVVGFPVKKVSELLARFKTPPVMVTIEDMDFSENVGKGKANGRSILVPGAVLGDTVRVQVLRESGCDLRGEIIRVEGPSPLRADPACRHFGTCGGCLFQNVGYSTQLELKERHLRRTLSEAGIHRSGTLDVRPVIPSPRIYGYRNKMEFGFGERWGDLVLGLRERGQSFQKSQRRTIGLCECPIFSPIVEIVFPAVLEFAKGRGLTAHNPATGRGALRHVALREGKRTGDLMVLLVTAAGDNLDTKPLAERLASELPSLKSFLHVTNSRVADIVSYEETKFLSGSPWITETLSGLAFRVYPETFIQTNTEAAELLYREIRRLAELSPKSRVLGLYCGSGAIELSLARDVEKVSGLDSLPANVRAAQENAAANRIVNADFISGTVEEYLKDMLPGSADVLLLDPPRPGLTTKAMKLVLHLDVPTIAYISCNPSALARDLGGFIHHGYHIVTIAPFDFFPHTPHLETLTLLKK